MQYVALVMIIEQGVWWILQDRSPTEEIANKQAIS